MQRLLVVLALSFLVASAAFPCSKKYAGQSAVTNRAQGPSARTASILVLSNKSLHKQANSLRKNLMTLGYKVKVVKSQAEIMKMLKSGKKIDIVMADIEAMSKVEEQLKNGGSNVVPVRLFNKNGKEDTAQIVEEYPLAMDVRSRSTVLKKQVEKALDIKEQKTKEANDKAS